VRMPSARPLLLEADAGFVPCHNVSTLPDWCRRVHVHVRRKTGHACPGTIKLPSTWTTEPIVQLLILRKRKPFAPRLQGKSDQSCACNLKIALLSIRVEGKRNCSFFYSFTLLLCNKLPVRYMESTRWCRATTNTKSFLHLADYDSPNHHHAEHVTNHSLRSVCCIQSCTRCSCSTSEPTKASQDREG
jgi:hypothetical protein